MNFDLTDFSEQAEVEIYDVDDAFFDTLLDFHSKDSIFSLYPGAVFVEESTEIQFEEGSPFAGNWYVPVENESGQDTLQKTTWTVDDVADRQKANWQIMESELSTRYNALQEQFDALESNRFAAMQDSGVGEPNLVVVESPGDVVPVDAQAVAITFDGRLRVEQLDGQSKLFDVVMVNDGEVGLVEFPLEDILPIQPNVNKSVDKKPGMNF
jgi:hypothetical protein